MYLVFEISQCNGNTKINDYILISGSLETAKQRVHDKFILDHQGGQFTVDPCKLKAWANFVKDSDLIGHCQKSGKSFQIEILPFSRIKKLDGN